MKKSNSQATQNKLRGAMRLAEFRDTDAADMKQCLNDMQTHAQLDESDAKVVANAWRNTFIRTAGPELGLNEDDINDLVGEKSEKPNHATEFADDNTPDDELSSLDDNLDTTEEEDDFNLGDLDDLGDDDEPSDETHDELPTAHSENDEFNTDEFNSGDTAELNVSVPTQKLDEVEEALRAILGDEAFADFNTDDVDVTMPEDETHDEDEFADDDFSDDDDDTSDPLDDTEGDDEIDFDVDEDDESDMPLENPDLQQAEGRENNMTKKMAGNGRSTRKEILASLENALGERTASEGVKPTDRGLGKDTSGNGKPFSYHDEAQYKGEDKRKTMTMQDSGSNSLKEQNPSYNELTVPTQNAERLQLKDNYKATSFEGGAEDKSFYEADFDKLDNVPSAGDENVDDATEVPTQMNDIVGNRKTTVASANEPDEEFEDHVYRTLEASGVPGEILAEMTWSDGVSAYNTIMSRQAELDNTPVNTENVLAMFKSSSKDKRAKIDKMASDLEIKIENADSDEMISDRKAQSMIASERSKIKDHFEATLESERKRIKAAYAIATRLVIAQAIQEDDVESTVGEWLDSGLSVKSIFSSGSLLLKTAQVRNLRESTSSTSNGSSTRIASAGLSIAPSIVPSHSSAPKELSTILSGVFSIGDVPRADFDKMLARTQAKDNYQF